MLAAHQAANAAHQVDMVPPSDSVLTIAVATGAQQGEKFAVGGKIFPLPRDLIFRYGERMKTDNSYPNQANAQADNALSVLGRTNFRAQVVPFGIKQRDRRAPVYLLGKTGTGKSTLLAQLMRQDIAAGRGLALLDPHGDLVAELLTLIPPERQNDVIYFNAPAQANPLGFNPLEPVAPHRQALAAAGVLEVTKKLWLESWGPRLEHILRHALLTLFAQQQATLADILRLLTEPAFRAQALQQVTNAQVRAFWEKEYAHYPERLRLEAIAPIQNKVGAFLADPTLQGILTQPKSAFKLRQVMDEKKILLVNLGKGLMGEDASNLLGALLLTRIGLAALSRAERPESERPDFYLYLDEAQNFLTTSLATILSEARKYHLNVTLANQHLAQLNPLIREAILGNVGTLISFRVGVSDAEILAPEFAPTFTATDLVNLPNYHMYLKLLIDGQVSTPFSAETLPIH